MERYTKVVPLNFVTQRLSLLTCHRAPRLYRRESLHLPRHIVTAVVLRGQSVYKTTNKIGGNGRLQGG